MAMKVAMPEMGEGVTEATIIQWLKKEGDTVEQYEPLVEVNTDKVDYEVPSPVSGTILKITVASDAVVEVDTILCWIGEPGEEIPEGDDDMPVVEPAAAPPAPTPPPPPAPTPTPSPAPVQAVVPPPPTAPTGSGLAGFISPLVARVAVEHNVDLGRVTGTGNGGRITKNDILRFVQSGGAASAPVAQVNGGALNTFISPLVGRLSAEHNIDLTRVTGTGKDARITKKDIQRVIDAGGVDPIPPVVSAPVSTADPGSAPAPASTAPAPIAAKVPGPIPGTTVKLDPVRRSIAKHMLHSVQTSPHVSTIMEADLTNLSAHRSANKAIFARDGAKLTFTVYFVSAIVTALKTYPMVNSSWSDDGVIIHKDINVGMATSLGADGLIVPVIKHADSLSLLGIARAVNDLADRARAKQLTPDEVRGGTFTITNHGGTGSLFATPIINQPQCGILGTGMIQKRAVVINDAIAIRPMVYLGLTFDHRILDGAVADYFLGTIKQVLEDWA